MKQSHVRWADVRGRAAKRKVENKLSSFQAWRSENVVLLQKYFDRYDLDKSGTLNGPDELQYLTINMVQSLRIRVSPDTIDKELEPVFQQVQDGKTED